MKKFILALTLAGISFGAQANIDGNGFYRVKNFGSDRWANLIDNHASVDIGASTADLHALQLTNNTEEILSDPGSIVLLTNISGKQYDVAAQGATLGGLIDIALNIGENGTAPDGQTLYRIYGTYKGATKYIGDSNLDPSGELGEASINVPNSFKDFVKWYFIPLEAKTDNYFGPVPTVSSNEGLYTSMFTSFAYQPYSEGVKAYYIARYGFGMAEMVEITGAVPPGCPVVLKCAGKSPSDNRMQILQMQDVLPSNALTGVYFNYESRTIKNQVAYDPETMRVLGTCSDGSLGFVTADIDFIPANTAYLNVPKGSSPELKCVSPEEYELNLPQSPEDFYFNESFVLLPQGDDVYEGYGFIPKPEGDNKDLKLRFYIPEGRAGETYVGPYAGSGADVKINAFETITTLPFDYNSPYYWVIPNWPGGDLSVSLNLQYQYAVFHAQNAGVESIEAGLKDIFYVDDIIICEGAKQIAVYDLAGHLSAKANGDRLDISHLPKGTYIANAGGKTLKIIR